MGGNSSHSQPCCLLLSCRQPEWIFTTCSTNRSTTTTTAAATIRVSARPPRIHFLSQHHIHFAESHSFRTELPPCLPGFQICTPETWPPWQPRTTTMRKQVSPRIGLAFCLYTRENILTILYSPACLPVTYLSQSIQCTTAAATNNQLMQAHPLSQVRPKISLAFCFVHP